MKIKKFFEAVEGAFQKMQHAEAAAFHRKYYEDGEVSSLTENEKSQIINKFKIFADEKEVSYDKMDTVVKLSKRGKSRLMSKSTVFDITINKLKDDWYFVSVINFVRIGESKTQFYKCHGFDELINGLEIVKKQML